MARRPRASRRRSPAARSGARTAVTAHRGGWIRATGRLDDPAIGLSATKRRNVRHMFAALRSGCVDCGERDLLVLEFDHIGAKRSNVTALGWSETSLARLDAEIAACEVRCCNCHRRRTAGSAAAAHGLLQHSKVPLQHSKDPLRASRVEWPP